MPADAMTLGRWPSDRALAHPGRVAIHDRGVAVTFAELEARAASLAAALIDAGHGRGSRVATLSGSTAANAGPAAGHVAPGNITARGFPDRAPLDRHAGKNEVRPANDRHRRRAVNARGIYSGRDFLSTACAAGSRSGSEKNFKSARGVTTQACEPC